MSERTTEQTTADQSLKITPAPKEREDDDWQRQSEQPRRKAILDFAGPIGRALDIEALHNSPFCEFG